ncbi:SAM-dependent methyltransferase [Saccharopolyspora sp. HNM0986]|uniref:SAM-dependent methyltransferase n=1 Tax=Saccharopolyspora galaxeae TaxID=2781241 RepID=UPI00190B0137|nr:SAM-dependent methyltransferase [Saccharopolyspora sp. HNM0986]MBK0868774.1 SAM-dependent methyltransferase [Saccharopolyspora sp. HNM0986]
MAERKPPEVLAGVDLERPNPGRIYDWFLGGNSNWAIDRVFGERLLGMWPQIAGVARQNRAFLQRVVVDALDAGIRQFLDLGSGIPTVGNVHEIVQQHTNDPASVVYVDCEPVATAHSRVKLEHTDWAGVVQADLMHSHEVLTHATTKHLLDRNEPVCLLAVAALQFVAPDRGIPAVLRRYGTKLATGSRVAVSHFASDVPDPDARAAMERFRTECDVTPNPLYLRDRDTIISWLDGLGHDWTLLSPGVTQLPDWRPEQIAPNAKAEAEKMRPFAWCGVAEKH